ncbi:MAG: cysteine--tRNA ligase [Acidimicrobiales bacterium]|nr:cysteine--tRNA ligase [Acidimicrobiales bacterium]
MKLYDSCAQGVIELDPGPIVTLYTCGITPYDAAHIGHGAVYVLYDVLQRRLRDLGHETRCVRNITDVDDDLLKKAREMGVNYLDLAAEQIALFDTSMKALNLLPAWSEPRATSAIPDILRHIGSLLDSKLAYQSNVAVYFDVHSVADFGSLSHLSETEMLAITKERGGNPEDPAKRNPLDVVLWQPSQADEPVWQSRWGPGRPGWHVECVALSLREHGGETLDIHGGGSDLLFPHHECERAQAEAVMGTVFSRRWVHVGMVKYRGEKMSKSLGNLVFIHDLLKNYAPGAIRLALLSHHYAESWEWNDLLMDQAADRYARYASLGNGEAGINEVRERLDDNLDTPSIIDILDQEAKSSKGVSKTLELLGIPVTT